MARYYFDCGPLMSLAESRSADGDDRSRRIGEQVERIFTESGSTRAVSEITLAELWTNLYVHWRASHWPSRDRKWVEGFESEILGLIEQDVILVLPPIPKIVEWGLVHVAETTRLHGKDLRAWDAIHLGYAVNWARESGERVRLVSSDKSMVGFLDLFPEFAAIIDIVELT